MRLSTGTGTFKTHKEASTKVLPTCLNWTVAARGPFVLELQVGARNRIGLWSLEL